jgi:hypothetical protein
MDIHTPLQKYVVNLHFYRKNWTDRKVSHHRWISENKCLPIPTPREWLMRLRDKDVMYSTYRILR